MGSTEEEKEFTNSLPIDLPKFCSSCGTLLLIEKVLTIAYDKYRGTPVREFTIICPKRKGFFSFHTRELYTEYTRCDDTKGSKRRDLDD